MISWKDKKDILVDLIEVQKLPYEQIGRMFNCSGNNIKKVAIRLGIELTPKRKINDNETFNKGTAKKGVCKNCGKEYNLYQGHRGQCCSHECWIEYQEKVRLEKWKDGEDIGYSGQPGSKLRPYIKRYIFAKNNNCCENCHKEYVNPYTGLSILQIHHKDGDATNNKEENLQLLCPNCHAMTENFGSRNKKSTRTYRIK